MRPRPRQPHRSFVLVVTTLLGLALVLGAAGQAASAAPPVKPGAVTGLAVEVSKPAAAYRLAVTWNDAARADSYRLRLTDTSGAVLATATVPTPGWNVAAARPAGTRLTVQVTPYDGRRRGKPVSRSTVLPDLTAPTGSWTVQQSTADERSFTVTQTSLGDDLSPTDAITRTLDWGDGTAPQVLPAGPTSWQHAYAYTCCDPAAFRPTMTLVDEAGNTAVVNLPAAVINDDDAPVGSFTAGPGSAWAKLTRVTVSLVSLSDNLSPAELVSRSVRWGDGTVTELGPRTSATHVFTAGGTFTPEVVLTDEAGNSRTVGTEPVVVRVDATAPVTRIARPRAARRVASWTTVRGRSTDVDGTGVKVVAVRAVQKRATGWFAYKPGTRTWTKASSKKAALRTASWRSVRPASTGRFESGLRRLRTGVLVVQARGEDRVGNRAVTVRKARLTRS